MEKHLFLTNEVMNSSHVFTSKSSHTLDCSPPATSIHGIFQARILEWVAISYLRESSQPSDQTHISCISCTGGQILHHCTTWEGPWVDLPSPITLKEPRHPQQWVVVWENSTGSLCMCVLDSGRWFCFALFWAVF